LHPLFKAYQELIVKHPAYKSLPNKFNAQGEVTWVRPSDKARALWWDELKLKHGLPDRASAARKVHPIELEGKKPCSVCGRELSINYVYPNQSTLERLNSVLPVHHFNHFNEDISMICKIVEQASGKSGLQTVAKCFKVAQSFETASELANLIIKAGKLLSPGVMSNAPDRLDGFHTYNGCCRSTVDTGRHASNLARYSTDRRAYENWADGNWRAADRLMGEFKKSSKQVPCPTCGKVRKMSADHIGPISLGFAHRMEFQPLCQSCNSAKGNRMTFGDLQKLLASENSGVQVVSWHSKNLWDSLKTKVADDSGALDLSSVMRKNMHYVLLLLSRIYGAGYHDFLSTLLSPEHVKYDYVFKNFEPKTGKFEYETKQVDSANTKKLAQRYLRISFSALDEYLQADNRHAEGWKSELVDQYLHSCLNNLELGNFKSARAELDNAVKEIANLSIREFNRINKI
jgi:Alw26I/Eco31I/Esp3I family type II restriction endonuclease